MELEGGIDVSMDPLLAVLPLLADWRNMLRVVFRISFRRLEKNRSIEGAPIVAGQVVLLPLAAVGLQVELDEQFGKHVALLEVRLRFR